MRYYKEVSRTKPSLDPSGNNTPLGSTKSSIFVRNFGRFCILGCTGAFLATWEVLHFRLQWCILDNLWGFAFLVVMVHILGNLQWHPCKQTFSQNCSLRRPHLKCSLSPPPPAKFQTTHSPLAKPWKGSKKCCCLKAWRHVHLLKQNVPVK